jgi:putative phosphoribosyl transferase
MTARFQNRAEAGHLLAQKLTAYAYRPDVLVLGLPRGGVPVAFEVAKALQVPMDIWLVRKLGVPTQKELAMGAIATGGVRVLNQEVVHWLGISDAVIDKVATQEQQELERRNQVYRGNRPAPDLRNRTVILVDDGLATGSTMHAAIASLRQQQPDRIVVAVPVAPSSIYKEFKREADEIVCLQTPESFQAIGVWYVDFSQTTDQEVRDLLEQPTQGVPSPGRPSVH